MFAFDHIRAFYWHVFHAYPDTDTATAAHYFDQWELYYGQSHMEDGVSHY